MMSTPSVAGSYRVAVSLASTSSGPATTTVPAVIVKLVFEMSKKILPTASTLMRAVVLAELGTVTVFDPVLGVEGVNIVGKLLPPSVDNEIFTFVAFTGRAAVPAGFHVTFNKLPPTTETAVLGAVTVNGPEVPSIVMLDIAVPMPPPLDLWSRAMT